MKKVIPNLMKNLLKNNNNKKICKDKKVKIGLHLLAFQGKIPGKNSIKMIFQFQCWIPLMKKVRDPTNEKSAGSQ